jgi:hypothetical protein
MAREAIASIRQRLRQARTPPEVIKTHIAKVEAWRAEHPPAQEPIRRPRLLVDEPAIGATYDGGIPVGRDRLLDALIRIYGSVR